MEKKNSALHAPPSFPKENYRVIEKLAHEAIDAHGVNAEHADLTEAVKTRAARLGIAYDSAVIGSALLSALFVRRGLHRPADRQTFARRRRSAKTAAAVR
jgi:hypothetical protein